MVREVFGYIGIIRDHVETYLDSRQYEKQNPILEDGAHNTKIFRIDQNLSLIHI